MKKRFIKAKEKDVIGTSFAGYILCTYEHLAKHLGPPKDMSGLEDWKTKAQWSFKTKGTRPTVITIYDYKEVIPITEVSTWHVGMKGDTGLLKDFAIESGIGIQMHITLS
jgi:hypothetical protein